jgi:phage major head subunit gpT-like protein
MAVINTGLLTKGLRSEFFDRFRSSPTYYQDLATRIVSTNDRETYRWLGTVPQMREWGTGRLARGLRTESYSVANLKYEATLEIDRDEIADDQVGQIRPRIAELALRAATHKDYLLADLLASGSSAGFNSYDGETFFSAAHNSGSSGVQSNTVSVDVSSVQNPTVEEFKAGIKEAIGRMLTFKDDQGAPMVLQVSGLQCVVPPSLYFTALEAVSAAMIADTSNVLKGVARVISLPWLTDASRWYLLKTDGVVRPFIFQDREPIEFGSLAEDSDEAFRREKYLYGVRARYRIAYGYWQYGVLVQMA